MAIPFRKRTNDLFWGTGEKFDAVRGGATLPVDSSHDEIGMGINVFIWSGYAGNSARQPVKQTSRSAGGISSYLFFSALVLIEGKTGASILEISNRGGATTKAQMQLAGFAHSFRKF